MADSPSPQSSPLRIVIPLLAAGAAFVWLRGRTSASASAYAGVPTHPYQWGEDFHRPDGGASANNSASSGSASGDTTSLPNNDETVSWMNPVHGDGTSLNPEGDLDASSEPYVVGGAAIS